MGLSRFVRGDLEGSDQNGTILKQFLIQNCTGKVDKSCYLFI